jgi:predicted transcriptional regulator
MINVSNEYLRKVEMFFAENVKEQGTNRIQATVQEVADGSSVALATAHKALKELSNRGIIDMVKPSSRRFPITYIYNGDTEFEIEEENLKGQVEHLIAQLDEYKELVGQLREENRALKKEKPELVL